MCECRYIQNLCTIPVQYTVIGKDRLLYSRGVPRYVVGIDRTQTPQTRINSPLKCKYMYIPNPNSYLHMFVYMETECNKQTYLHTVLHNTYILYTYCNIQSQNQSHKIKQKHFDQKTVVKEFPFFTRSPSVHLSIALVSLKNNTSYSILHTIRYQTISYITYHSIQAILLRYLILSFEPLQCTQQQMCHN